jgi:hypothetical protein
VSMKGLLNMKRTYKGLHSVSECEIIRHDGNGERERKSWIEVGLYTEMTS